MKKNKKIFRVIFVVALWGVMMVGGSAFGQEKYPTKPITLIISWTAGGGQDMVARGLSPLLEKSLGQNVVVKNTPGGGGSIGFMEIMRSNPDGYTFGQASPSISILPYMMKTDVFYTKYEPIAYGGYSPGSIMVRTESPFKTIKDFLDYCKANPGKVTVGNTGHGSIGHMLAISIEKAAGVKFVHVPYKGGAPSFTAALGGHIDCVAAWIGDAFPLVRGNKLRVLAVTAPVRSKFVPDVPTFKELGIDSEVVTGYAWVGPKGIPKDRINMLYNAFKKALESAEFAKYADDQGTTISIKNPEEFGKFLVDQDKMWKALIEGAGFKPE
jgi:tripartite-type tricarboxylate transporter receptor subunit TctC